MGQRRLVILGLDGATWEVIRPAVERGELPTLARLMQKGSHGTLLSSPIPVSPCAWTCITTGKNPAKHGVYDFCRREADAYRIGVVNGRFVRSKRLWDLAGEAGKRSVVLNVPVTYPPRPIQGALVSGLLTPSVRAAFTAPARLGGELLRAVPDYKIATTEILDPKHPERFAEDVRAVLEAREKAARYLHEHHAADFEMYVFMALDHVQHKLWRRPGATPDPSGRPGRAVLEIYRQADACLGRMMALYDDRTTFLVISDHGFGPLERVFRINRWLMREGWLVLRRSWRLAVKKQLARTRVLTRTYRLMQRLGMGRVARFVPKNLQHAVATSGISFEDVDWQRTRAYSYGEFGQIYVNLKGREPEGIVRPGTEQEELLGRISDRLRLLRDPDSGEPIVREVHRKEDLYRGPLLDRAPDLTFSIGDFRYDSSVAFGFEQDEVLGRTEFYDSGSHRPEGILLAKGPTIRPGATVTGASVYDVAPTALHLMGLAVPRDMDGRVLTEMLTDGREVAYTGPSDPETGALEQPETEDYKAVEERLRALGYMD